MPFADPSIRAHTTAGYRKYFDALNAFLSADPDVGKDIELVPCPDRGLTGNFIVRVRRSGYVLHSTQMGQGKASSKGERLAILDQIKEILEDS